MPDYVSVHQSAIALALATLWEGFCIGVFLWSYRNEMKTFNNRKSRRDS